MAASSNLVTVLCFVIFGTFAHSARLNVGRLLLPSNQGVATNYTLEVTEGGCYKWTSSRQEIISVASIEVNLNRMCSTKAILSAVSTYPGRHSVIVLAIDEDTGLNLRCDVTVDVIHSIEIVTTTREIFLEDAPVAFEIQARNDQEDTFSCLDGVAFEWLITDPVGKQAENKVLRFLNFADSPYETPPAIDFWEQQGLHGYKILMEGVKTGTAKASVRPRDTIYKNIRSSEVTLMIVANLMLNPARDVYILPRMTIQYQVNLIKQRKAYVIPMPSDQYYLEIANPEIATLDSQTSTVTGLSLGYTQIILKDKNIKLEEVLHQPSAGIHVASPSHIIFRIKPGNKWSLQELLSYVITIEIYDDKNNEIHLSDNLRIHATFPSKYFYVNYSSTNGTYHNVQALIPGTCKIQGEISGIIQDSRVIKLHTPVSGYQEVTIYQVIKIMPPFVFLPWSAHVQPKYSLTLKAVGGTGSYRWLTSNGTIAMLSNEEHLDKIQVITLAPGTVNITAIDMMNSLFTDFAKITIQPIASLEILPTIVETEVGKDVILPLAIYGYETEDNKKIMFHNCSQIPINVHVNPAKFIFNEATDVISSVGCRSLLFTCKAVGHSEVVVQYNSGKEVFNATAVIACHKQLQPLQPVRVALLALGSSLDVAFEGGPRPWPLYAGGHYVRTQTATSEIVDVTELHDSVNYNKDIHSSRVLCKYIGEVILNVTVGNVPSPNNPNPMKSHASIKIVCAVPYSIQLQAKKKEPKTRKFECPMLQSADKIPVQCYQDLDIVLVVQDKLGRKFLNISSLHVRWELSDDNLAKLDNTNGIVSEIANVVGYRKVVRNFQKLHPYGKEGHLKVTTSIIGYNQEMLYKESINTQWNADIHVFHSLILDLVHDAEVTPESLSVFNHPSIKSHINILKGSGHFFVESSDRRKANIQYKPPRQIEIVPIEDGTFSIIVQDLCLESAQLASSQVRVSGISSIRVHMVNKVELGKSFIATVSIVDGEKNLLPASLFSLVNLTSIVSSDIVSIKPHMAKNDLQQFQAKYLVTGLSLGHTSVIFAASYTGATTVSSESLSIQVFPPLHIEPRNVTLIVGAMFQVTCSGGPQPQSNVEHSISDQNIATVTSAGIIAAGKLGKSFLTAKAVGIDQNTGQSVVYSQDQIAVNVVILKGIKIKAPLTRMEIGTEMPVYAVGLNEQEIPFAFGSAIPKLHFKWHVTNQNVVEMKSLYYQNGIQHSNENNFAMVIQAKQAGRVTLQLGVSPTKHSTGTQMQVYQNSVLMDEVQIEVYEKLKLTMPEADGDKLLMSLNSQKKLLNNRDGVARISYSIIPHGNDIGPDITIDNTGVLKTGSNTGAAIILIVAHEEFDVEQRLSILVEVKLVSYMSVRPDAIIRTDSRSLAVIPLGLKMTLQMYFHDDVGRTFHALNIRLKFRPSRFDLIQISQGQENSTLKIHALKAGMTVMKIWDANNPHITSYIITVVGTAIDPVERWLTIGDIICFTSPLITQEGQYGSWFTTSNFMAIHSATGVAVSQQIGTDNIYYNVSNILVTSIQVTTKPISVIVIDRTAVKHLTNVLQEKPFRIPVFLRSDQNQRHSNLLGRNCSEDSMNSLSSILSQFPFVCELSLVKPSIDVSANEIFEAKAGFDWQKGQYHCAISPINKSTPYEISILVTDVQLHVRLLDSAPRQIIHPTAVLTTEAITFPFYPAFHLRVDELVLSNVQPVAEVAISAMPFVQKCLTVVRFNFDCWLKCSEDLAMTFQVLPSDSNILDIHSPKVDSSHSNTVLFSVAIRDISSLWQVDVLVTSLHIEVSCTVTKQLYTIPVKLKLIGQKDGTHCPVPTYGGSGWKSFSQAVWENYQSFMVTTLSVIGTGAALFIGYRALVGSRSPTMMTSQPNVFLHSFGEGYSPAATLPYGSRRPFSPGDSAHMQGGSRSLLWSINDASRTSPERHSPNLRTSHIGQ